ncbi:leucyl aminopeptidase [Sulfobacillus harzensis]|uniref:Probable cytosol aminopeptidase n=1 Tax=Sulfobacillus harzensis TaxID=2729629 RepID=A0A7Y0Q0W1_9FIRM|nr:leucyl aminopeptidase [Sulfobacillus harzensis]NMP20822.1 leucyl aminopeptidase [Sulfobacillus harzensis]
MATVHISQGSGFDLSVDLLVVGVYQGEVPEELDRRFKGAIREAVQRDEASFKWLNSWSSYSFGAVQARRVAVLGLGEKGSLGVREWKQVGGHIGQLANEAKAKSLAVMMPETSLAPEETAEFLTEGLLVGSWHFAGYKADPPQQSWQEATLAGWLASAEAGVRRGEIIARAQNFTRDLGFRPSNKLYPELLAQEAVKAGQSHGFSVEVFDENKLAELGMEALLGVGAGSAHPPRLVVMRYQGGGSRTLALVGKGITFDTGGISLKPPLGMEEMKYDMLGAGAVLGAMMAIADLKLPINVVGLMAVAQNMPSGTAYKPGDVVKAFNGKTIEVTNTDAEGRVALSDAVSYAAHLGVDWIVETSTLTGAVVVVLGHEATGLVATDDPLASLVLQASEASGERVWRLPIYPEYKKLYHSDVADMKNSPGRDAGTITAGMIISEFAGNVPYAHLDIAGTAWTPKGPLNNVKNGPTGVMVPTFVKLADMLSR